MTGRWSKLVVTIAICDELGLGMWDDSLPPAPDNDMGMSEFGPHSPAPQVPTVTAPFLLRKPAVRYMIKADAKSIILSCLP